MVVALQTPFIIDLGYSLTTLAYVAKNAGLWGSIAGGLIGGVDAELGINRALWILVSFKLRQFLIRAAFSNRSK